jgi:hypothetical protein
MAKIPGFTWLEGDEIAFRLQEPASVLPADLASYARAYRTGAETLHEIAVTSEAGKELLFPIAFLWRHYLELTLKRILLQLDGGSIRNGLLRSHDLLWLWDQAERTFREAWPEAKEHGWIRRLLAEFQKLDPRADGFRYPISRKGKPTQASRFAIGRPHESRHRNATPCSGPGKRLQ